MKILVVGSGGREHALCWALAREQPTLRLLCAPGNAGTSDIAVNVSIPADAVDDLAAFADRERIDFVVVGPEAPLAAGLVDRLTARGIRAFGPTQAAAQIEASKAWAKEIMREAGVPTAASETFRSAKDALAFIDGHPEPLVVKASGLAAGKGAVVCPTRREARAAVVTIMENGSLGSAGDTVLVESFLEGEELSVMALTNGTDLVILPPAQDHKRLLDGDQGPNTGGMGAYSPVSIATAKLLSTIKDTVFLPTLAAMDRRQARFRGVLYAGLMIGPDGLPSVIEFNCRFGDPETQVILPQIGEGLLTGLLACGEDGPLPPITLTGESAVTTVLAARGYPDQVVKGDPISIPSELPEDVVIFHAGTLRDEEGVIRTNGGRVLTVTGLGQTFGDARVASQLGARLVQFAGKQFRPDIGWRETARSPVR